MIQPGVSVILPVFNGRRYLRESIESVLQQTFPHFELLICDDGSSDDSPDLITSYADPRIRFLRNSENLGLFPTLNRLVDQARCELIRLWSQDDRMTADCLRTETEFWKQHSDLAMCYCGFETIDASGRVTAPPKVDDTPEVIEPWLASQISFYHGCMPGNIATVSVRKTVLRQVGPFAPLRVAGDFEMWTRICGRFPIGRIPHALIQLRSHADQFSRWTDAALDCMKECEPIFAELARRFPPELQSHVRRYRDRSGKVSYFHHAVRSVLALRLGVAWGTIKFLMQTTNPLRIGFWWLLSLNRRKFLLPAICQKPRNDEG